MDGISVDVDADALMAALVRLGPAAEAAVDVAALATSTAIVREAKARLARQLSGSSSGQTLEGIQITRADRGGFVVGVSRPSMPNVPLWIEKGTKKGKPRSHAQTARPYFYDSAELEEGPHLRRVADAIAQVLADQGLGD